MDGTQKLAHRISEIIRRLYAGETLQRDALVAEFAVSERTIFRDLNRLSDWMEADTSSSPALNTRCSPSRCRRWSPCSTCMSCFPVTCSRA